MDNIEVFIQILLNKIEVKDSSSSVTYFELFGLLSEALIEYRE